MDLQQRHPTDKVGRVSGHGYSGRHARGSFCFGHNDVFARFQPGQPSLDLGNIRAQGVEFSVVLGFEPSQTINLANDPPNFRKSHIRG